MLHHVGLGTRPISQQEPDTLTRPPSPSTLWQFRKHSQQLETYATMVSVSRLHNRGSTSSGRRHICERGQLLRGSTSSGRHHTCARSQLLSWPLTHVWHLFEEVLPPSSWPLAHVWRLLEEVWTNLPLNSCLPPPPPPCTCMASRLASAPARHG